MSLIRPCALPACACRTQTSVSPNDGNVSAINGTTPDLIDYASGISTGMSITGSSDWKDFAGDDAGTFPNQSWLIQPATVDGAGLAGNATGIFTISGMTTFAYSIEIVSART